MTCTIVLLIFFINRHHCPILIAQWQYAVTRKDMAKTFSFEDFKEVMIYDHQMFYIVELNAVLVLPIINLVKIWSFC